MIKVNLVADMDCDRCGRPAVIFQPYSGLHLCTVHVRDDIFRKAKKTIRQHAWLRPGDRIALACSEGSIGIALLDFMKALVNGRKDVSIFAILDGDDNNADAFSGISGADALNIGGIRAQQKNPLHLVAETEGPFAKKHETENFLSCAAKENHANVLAMSYPLEYHAEWALWKAVNGEMPGLLKKRPINGRQFRIIRPFMHIPAIELDICARMVLEKYNLDDGLFIPEHRESTMITRMLEEFGCRHPGSRFALVNIWEDISRVVRQSECRTPPERGHSHGP